MAQSLGAFSRLLLEAAGFPDMPQSESRWTSERNTVTGSDSQDQCSDGYSQRKPAQRMVGMNVLHLTSSFCEPVPFKFGAG